MKKKIYNFICCVVIATISVYTDYAKGDVVVAKNEQGKQIAIKDRNEFEQIIRDSRNCFMTKHIFPESLVWNENGDKKSCSFNKSNFDNYGKKSCSLEMEFNNEQWVMPGFAAFFKASNLPSKLYLGVKRLNYKQIPPSNVDKNGTLQVNIEKESYKNNSHTERQLISQCIADNKICSDTKGTICVFTRAHPCVNIGNPENGNICCVDYYEQLAQLYKNINFHIYFYVGDGRICPGNFQATYFNNDRCERTFRLIRTIVQLLTKGAKFENLYISKNGTQLLSNNGPLVNWKKFPITTKNWWFYNNNPAVILNLVNQINTFLNNNTDEQQVSDLFNHVWEQLSNKTSNNIKYHAITIAR